MGCPRPNVPRSNPYDPGELDKVLRDRLWTMFQDAPGHGLTLVSGYRDPGRQWDIRAERVGAANACNPRVKAVPATATPAVWNGKAWVGGSDHQRRTAADIGGRDLLWAIENRHRYGLGLTVSTENWHFQATGTDKRTGRRIGAPTVRIIEYPGVAYDNPGPINRPAPKPAPTPNDWTDMATEAELRKIIREEMGPVTLRLIAIDRALTTIAKNIGSGVGWAKAHAIKAGVARTDAVKNDPTHKG